MPSPPPPPPDVLGVASGRLRIKLDERDTFTGSKCVYSLVGRQRHFFQDLPAAAAVAKKTYWSSAAQRGDAQQERKRIMVFAILIGTHRHQLAAAELSALPPRTRRLGRPLGAAGAAERRPRREDSPLVAPCGATGHASSAPLSFTISRGLRRADSCCAAAAPPAVRGAHTTGPLSGSRRALYRSPSP